MRIFSPQIINYYVSNRHHSLVVDPIGIRIVVYFFISKNKIQKNHQQYLQLLLKSTINSPKPHYIHRAYAYVFGSHNNKFLKKNKQITIEPKALYPFTNFYLCLRLLDFGLQTTIIIQIQNKNLCIPRVYKKN
jgi:hypothetical protein